MGKEIEKLNLYCISPYWNALLPVFVRLTTSSSEEVKSYLHNYAGVHTIPKCPNQEQILHISKQMTSDDKQIVRFLRRSIFRRSIKSGNILLYHAATAIHRNGTALALLGNKGSGKTTLLTKLVERGWEVMGNDIMIVRTTENHDAVQSVGSLPFSIGLGQRTYADLENSPILLVGEQDEWLDLGDKYENDTKARVDHRRIFGGADVKVRPSANAAEWVILERRAQDDCSKGCAVDMLRTCELQDLQVHRRVVISQYDTDVEVVKPLSYWELFERGIVSKNTVRRMTYSWDDLDSVITSLGKIAETRSTEL